MIVKLVMVWCLKRILKSFGNDLYLISGVINRNFGHCKEYRINFFLRWYGDDHSVDMFPELELIVFVLCGIT